MKPRDLAFWEKRMANILIEAEKILTELRSHALEGIPPARLTSDLVLSIERRTSELSALVHESSRIKGKMNLMRRQARERREARQAAETGAPIPQPTAAEKEAENRQWEQENLS